MDIAKIIEPVLAAGPGAGIGLAVGLLVFLGLLVSGRVVMVGRFTDMKEQRDEARKRVDKLEQDKTLLERDKSELLIMVSQSVSITRKNAHLASSMMNRYVQQQEDPDDGSQLARIAGR